MKVKSKIEKIKWLYLESKIYFKYIKITKIAFIGQVNILSILI